MVTQQERIEAFDYHEAECRRLSRFMDKLGRIRSHAQTLQYATRPRSWRIWQYHRNRVHLLTIGIQDALEAQGVHLDAAKRAWRGR